MSVSTDIPELDGDVSCGVHRLKARTYTGQVVYYVAEEHPDTGRPFIVDFFTCDPESRAGLRADLWERFTAGDFRVEEAVA